MHFPAANKIQSGPLRENPPRELVGKALPLLSRLSQMMELIPIVHACKTAERKSMYRLLLT